MEECMCNGSETVCGMSKLPMTPRIHYLCKTHQQWRDAFADRGRKIELAMNRSNGSLAIQAVSFSRSIAIWVLSLFRIADRPEINRRLASCSKCGFIKKTRFGLNKCGVCHCLLFAKTSFAHEQCPIGMWGPIRKPDFVYPCGRVTLDDEDVVSLKSSRGGCSCKSA